MHKQLKSVLESLFRMKKYLFLFHKKQEGFFPLKLAEGKELCSLMDRESESHWSLE